jgi:hypothetical protein
VSQFLKTANPEDEFFLIEFNDRPQLAVRFTPNAEEIQNHLTFTQAKGSTALLDALYLAMNQMKKALVRDPSARPDDLDHKRTKRFQLFVGQHSPAAERRQHKSRHSHDAGYGAVRSHAVSTTVLVASREHHDLLLRLASSSNLVRTM